MCTPHLTQFGSNSSSIAWSITTPSSNDTVPMEWTRRQVTVRSQPSSRSSSTDCGPVPVARVDHQGSSHDRLVSDDERIARDTPVGGTEHRGIGRYFARPSPNVP
uniref:Uncharacterized protein n=1 Tax=Proboscia inermis TaxID=420281 RepID=A0A7S0G8L5_9STRA